MSLIFGLEMNEALKITNKFPKITNLIQTADSRGIQIIATITEQVEVIS